MLSSKTLNAGHSLISRLGPSTKHKINNRKLIMFKVAVVVLKDICHADGRTRMRVLDGAMTYSQSEKHQSCSI